MAGGMRALMAIWAVIFMVIGVAILIPLFVWKVIGAIVIIIIGVILFLASMVEG